MINTDGSREPSDAARPGLNPSPCTKASMQIQLMSGKKILERKTSTGSPVVNVQRRFEKS